MGLIMKFYAADPEMVVTLCKRMASVQTIEEASLIWEQLDSYPHADFSLNFTIPDHTDALCQAMIVEGMAVSPSSLDLFEHRCGMMRQQVSTTSPTPFRWL